MARSSKDRLPPPSGSTASRRSIGDGGSSSSSSRSGGSGVERGRRSSLELSGDPLHPAIFPLPKSKWVPNDVTSVCMACGSGFSKRIFLGSGKHHCRKCGRVVCGECIKNSIYSHKVCDPCFVAFSTYAKVKDTDFSGLNPTHGATYAAMYVAVKASHMDSERKGAIVGKCAPSQLKPTTSKSSTTGSGIDEILYRDDDEDDDDDTESETESESEYESSDNEASRSSKENMDDEKMAMSMAMAKKKSTITVIRRELPKMTMKMDLTSVSVSKMRDNEKKEDETLVEEADDLILYKKEEEKEDSVEKPESESEYESASDGDEDEDDSEMIERAVVTLIEDDGDANANELNNHSLGNDSLMITTIATPAAGSRAGRARVLDREHSDGGSIDIHDEDDDDDDDALAAVAKSSSLIVRTQLGTLEEQLKQSTGDLLLYLDDDDEDDGDAADRDKDSSESESDGASDAKLAADDEDYSAV